MVKHRFILSKQVASNCKRLAEVVFEGHASVILEAILAIQKDGKLEIDVIPEGDK